VAKETKLPDLQETEKKSRGKIGRGKGEKVSKDLSNSKNNKKRKGEKEVKRERKKVGTNPYQLKIDFHGAKMHCEVGGKGGFASAPHFFVAEETGALQ